MDDGFPPSLPASFIFFLVPEQAFADENGAWANRFVDATTLA
jgi:hypothetical protein